MFISPNAKRNGFPLVIRYGLPGNGGIHAAAGAYWDENAETVVIEVSPTEKCSIPKARILDVTWTHEGHEEPPVT